MAMSLTSITPIINELYIPGVEKYVYSEDFLTNKLATLGQVEKVGRNFNVRVQTGFSEGVKTSDDATAALPTARQTQFKNYKGTVMSLKGRIRVYRELIDYTNGFEKGAMNVIDAEINGVQEVMKAENERHCIADSGETPLCCVASATVSSESDTWVTVTVDSGGGVALCGSAWPTRYLRPGMIIDILTSGYASVSGTSTESLEILDVTSGTTFTITCASNAAADSLAALLADGQTIFHEDGYNAEPEGLKSLFGSTTNTVYDASRATSANSYLRPYVTYVNSSEKIVAGAPTGTAVDWSTLNVRVVMTHQVQINHASKSDLYLFADQDVADMYVQNKKQENGYFIEGSKIDGWPYEVITVEGRPMLSPTYMVANAICIVPMNKMVKYECKKLGFIEEFGGMWDKVPGYDAVEAYLVATHQYGCTNFKQGAWIGDLKGVSDT